MAISSDIASAPEETASQVGSSGVPAHVAIIMDGNGRWAKARNLPRTEGHRKGLEALRGAVRHAIERKIQVLTVFSFSSENWSRPQDEIHFLLQLLKHFVDSDLKKLHKENVHVQMIGRRDNLSPDILALIERAETLTASNTGLKLVIAFNYGGRDEISRAAADMALALKSGKLSEDAVRDPDVFASYLDTGGLPEPDLLIRTSGETRISNFLLWQCAYTEFVFLPCLWPDFSAGEFDNALHEFSCRQRRFGGLG